MISRGSPHFIAVGLLAAQCWAATAAHAAEPRRSSSVAEAFDAAMRAWVAKHDIPRASVAVMRKDRLVFAEGYGGRGANERVAIWSMSKPITGVCIATLVQEGKLAFDATLGEVLAPMFARHGPPSDERLNSVTVAQLLSHRSGLPEQFGDNRFAPGAPELLRQRPLQQATAAILLPAIVKVRLATEPGAKYAYSNVGFLLLGEIVATVTGQSYEKACGERVLAKAGIRDPRLDAKWGRLLQSTAGWGLSGPEYLGFARLLSRRRDGVLTPATHDFMRVAEGKWIDDRRVFAYTMGVNLHTFPAAPPNIYHGGGWLWHGTYAEKRGTWFVLANDGTAWFASFDGMLSFSNPKEVGELQEALWRAYRSVTVWPTHDLFARMGVGPVASRRAQ
jgi:CubicO group peptidase (beta-lactamase class C family)